MPTPGYEGQVTGRDCDCEDFPCCGHGLTERDYEPEYDSYEDFRSNHDMDDFDEIDETEE